MILSICSFILVQFCISESAISQTIKFSYSYFNITRNNGGGTLEAGDIIEVHALGFVEEDASVSRLYFIDSIRNGTQYIPNSLKIITNEGMTLTSFTDASNYDAGVYDASVPGIRVNMGTSSPGGIAQSGSNFYSTSGGGSVTGGDVPVAGPGTLAIIAYRLLVTADFGDTLHLGGNFYYRESKKTKKFHFENTDIKIIQNTGFCQNYTGASFTAESSFGNGNTQNRPSGFSAPGYTKVNITTNTPHDNYYAVVNNTSGDGTTDNSGLYKPNSHRVFGAWDIVGDHTNATNSSLGNLPVKQGKSGGYMILVNADYNTGLTYEDVITDVCPNTYYEFSAWVRNLCGQCGADIYGTPTGPGKHGVLPNLTFTINHVDYYTTGNIEYSGQWVKRGFIYKTGPGETSFELGIKNNASGGDGNDWVLDDINLSVCYPNLIMNPNDTAAACAGSPISVTDTVKSYFNTYNYYRWEKSTDGITWTPISTGNTKTPTIKNGLYVYHVDTVFSPNQIDSGTFLRVKVATSLDNLTDGKCAVNNTQQVFLKVYNSESCPILKARNINLNGTIINGRTLLNWTIQNPQMIKGYEIEKSLDGIHFTTIEETKKITDLYQFNYTFSDPDAISNTVYYRLKFLNADNSGHRYSRIISLYNRDATFKIKAVNPFNNELQLDVFLPAKGKIDFLLYDVFGKVVNKKTREADKGNTRFNIEDVFNLPPGMYILRTHFNGMAVVNKLVKTN